MPGFPYETFFAVDPSNSTNVAVNASIVIFEPGDETMTPVTIWDLSRTVQLPNPFMTNDRGFAPAPFHDTLPVLSWAGGGYSNTIASIQGLVDNAEAARDSASLSAQAAQSAADNAVANVDAKMATAVADVKAAKDSAAVSAALVNAPADTVTATLVGNPATATAAALNVIYAPIAAIINAVRPTGTRTAWLGDSIIRGDDEQPPIEGKTTYIRGDSIPNYTALQSGQRVRDWRNAGIFGNTSASGLARVQADVIDHKPTACVVFFGANDSAGGVSVEQFAANMTGIVDALHAADIKVFLMTPIPQNGLDARNAVIKSYGEWLKSYGAVNGIHVIDLYTAATDPATGYMYASFNGDGTHPGPAGQKVLGKYIADSIKLRFPPTDMELSTIGADPTSLIQVGTFTDPPIAGIAGGWGVYGSTPSDAIMSVVTDPQVQGKMQRITRSSAGGNMVIYVNVTTGYAPGDILQLGGIVTTSGPMPTARLLFNHPTLFLYADALRTTQTITRGRFELEAPVPDGTTSINVQLFGGPGTGNADFGQVTLRNLTALGLV